MSPPLLLQTKLTIPPARGDLVARPRLLARLDQGLAAGRRLILLAAPAGYGKTTLVGQWLARIAAAGAGAAPPGRAWLSLDPADNEPARFFAYFLAALQQVDPAIAPSAAALLRAGQPPPTIFMTALANDLAGRRAPLLLVLDDYHVLEAEPSQQALAFLLENMPPALHLVLTSRVEPPFPLARWRARGWLGELRLADLQFTPAETAQFLNEHMRLGLSPAQQAALAGRHEGWVAGLQLSALAWHGRAPTAPAAAPPAAAENTIFDYLSQEVWQQQPPDLRAFLLQTAFLDQFSAPLCDAVTGRDDSQQLLERLERANLFLLPLDGRRRWWRYHTLFLATLRRLLPQHLSPAEIAALQRRASAWYEANDMPAQAIDQALAAADFERAAALVEAIAASIMYESGQPTLLQRWLASLPDEVRHARPGLLIHQAWLWLWQTDLDPIEPLLQLIETAPAPAPAAIAAQVAAIRALVASVRQDAGQAISLAQAALALQAPADKHLRGLTLSALGNAYRARGDLRAAAAAGGEAIVALEATGQLIPLLVLLATQAQLMLLQGQRQRAEAYLARAWQLARERQASQLPAVAGVHVAQGRLRHWQGRLEDAADHLQQGIELGLGWPGFADEALDGLLGLARVFQAQGDSEAAGAALAQAESLANRFGLAQWRRRLAAHRARLQLASGEMVAASAWARRRQATLAAATAGGALAETERTVLARYYTARGDWPAAQALLTPLLRAAEEGGRFARLLELLLLQASLHQRQRDTPAALATLGRALALGQPQAAVGPFLDEGAPLAALLARGRRQAAWPGPAMDAYVARLQAALPAGREKARAAAPLPEPLTPRERQVLQLLVAGRTNPEIAGELIIAVTTVKSHVKHIYAKLGVANRYQAIARARQLNLLPAP